jgi:hypothetical protein
MSKAQGKGEHTIKIDTQEMMIPSLKGGSLNTANVPTE